MGCAMAIDTNVFLLASEDVNCARVAHRACYGWDHMLIWDEVGKIRAEYKEHAKEGSRLREFMALAVERAPAQAYAQANNGPFQSVLSMRSRITSEEYGLTQCAGTAEPHLFGVVRGQSETYLVIPENKFAEREPIRRCYRDNDKLQLLCDKLKDVQIATTENLAWLHEPGDPAPKTKEQLAAYIKDHRQDPHSAERAFYELKCPEDIEAGIASHLVDGIMDAVCAMTNRRSGYIFVGVKDDGDIRGVPKKYNSKPVSSWDLLWRNIESKTRFFSPRKPLIDQWWIEVVKGEKYVLALRVERQRGQSVNYRSEERNRSGTASPRRDAVNGRARK